MKASKLIVLFCIFGLLLITPAAAEERVVNGGFTNGLNGWSVEEFGSTSDGYGYVQGGSGYASFSLLTSDALTSPYADISQTVDLTDVDTIYFDTYGVVLEGSVSDRVLYVYVGGITKSYTISQLGTSGWTTQSIDVSGLSGNQNLRFSTSLGGDYYGSTRGVGIRIADVSAYAEKLTLDFTAYPTSGNPPLDVQFSISGQNIQNVVWDFGDGTTSTVPNPTHTYQSSSTPYTVSVTGYSASGKSITTTKQNYITASPQSLTWNKSTYTAGDIAQITWSLRNPDFNTYTYTLQVLPSDSQGNIAGSSSVITPITISQASGSTTIDTTGYSGYYTAAIFQSGSNIPLVIGTANIFTVATLPINLAVNGETYTENTTVTLSKDGSIVQTATTSTGQTQFTTTTGTYLISATTTGYATQTATVNLLSSTTITVDFVTGSSQGGTPSGSGSSYASTFITFRALDETTGVPLSGVSIHAIGLQATSPLDWIGQLFGLQWGEEILDTEVKGNTDSYGAITFPMFLSVQYTITATYGETEKVLIMTPSSLQSEYIIEIPHYKKPDATAEQAVLTAVQTTNDGNLTISYNDTSLTTTTITAQIYQKFTYDDNYTLLQTIPAVGNVETINYEFTDYKGTDIKIVITAETGKYGTIERTYYHTYPGMMVDLGLPDEVYAWICVLTAILIAGIATYLQAPLVAFAIVFIEWVYYFLGWANFFGAAFPFALILATLLSIGFYMASRR